MSTPNTVHAILALPRLRVQNANAVSGPFTHGFPSITAFTGLMWALQRKLREQGLPALQLQKVGVICHGHEEQIAEGYVKTFRLTRNPVDKDGGTAAIVEEGRIHLDITLVFLATLDLDKARQAGLPELASASARTQLLQEWAREIGRIVSCMRVAGGTVLPTRPVPGRRTRPWLETLPEDSKGQTEAFSRWRRQWLPGYALVGRDDLLDQRLSILRQDQPGATLLDAWLHASRFNHEPVLSSEGASGSTDPAAAKVRWADPLRGKGSGWTVPIPIGYASLQGAPRPAGTVAHARDAATPLAFVESIYSLGEWISPHRLRAVEDLLWTAETDHGQGIYRCRSGYVPSGVSPTPDTEPAFD